MSCSELQQAEKIAENVVFSSNLAVFSKKYPFLAKKIDFLAKNDLVYVLPARDGCIYYACKDKNGLVPVSDPVNPLQRMQMQLDQYATQLSDTTRPVLIVGLYPGNELISIFELSDKIRTPHCPQPIWVCVDSSIGLCGFLKAWDARQIIESPRVKFFWHEDLPKEVENLAAHPEIPHVFTLISGASDRTLGLVLPPLAALIQARDQELVRLCEENNRYYDSLDDRQLAEAIADRAGRKPRLLMPTCSWSTFIQHSTRDTCAAFEQLGWETRILQNDAMMTPYYLARQINEFKPDVFLFIDHLRHEAEEIYPRNMMFITWVQDEMAHIHCAEAGRKMTEYAAGGRRDLVIGHVDRLEKSFGYPGERLVQLTIPADPRVFRPVSVSAADRAKYGCDIAFMSNCGMPSDQVLETRILPVVEPWGIGRATATAIHDHLWQAYRAGRTFIDRNVFLEELKLFPVFTDVYERSASPSAANGESRQDTLLRLFLWGLNDTIYRHVILEWADEMGVNMHLYGHGWERHPRFARYARGSLAHGEELNTAYQAAALNLHLNIAQGMHQRLWEMMATGAAFLLRAQPIDPNAPPAEAMHELAQCLMEDRDPAQLSTPHQEAMADYIFRVAIHLAQTESSAPLEQRVMERIEATVMNRPEWIIPDFEQHAFRDRAGFEERVSAWLKKR